MQSMVDMHRAQFLGPATGGEAGNGEQTSGENNNASATTRTIAAGLVVKSGTDLVLAACLKSSRQNKPQYGRKEILDAMKEATGYSKGSYTNNLSTALSTLVKQGKLLEQAKEVYALSVNTKKELEARLQNGARA